MEFGPSLASLSRFLFKRKIMITPFSLPASLYLRVLPGGLGAVWWRLRRVVPPGVRGRVVWNGRERGLHLHGLFAEGRRSERRRTCWGNDCGRGDRGERGSEGSIDVRCRRAESAIDSCSRLLVSHACCLPSKPSNFTSAAARDSGGELALEKGPGLHLILESVLVFQPVRLYSICGTE